MKIFICLTALFLFIVPFGFAQIIVNKGIYKASFSNTLHEPPDNCWKVVQSVSSKKVLFCGWFTNTSHATVEEITVSELEKRLHSHIILLK